MMTLRTPAFRALASRQAEGEGILRMFLLAAALAMPLGTVAYLKIQHTRLSYDMSKLKAQLQEQEEATRVLLMERSRLRRDEEIQDFANRSGLVPRKQAHLIQRGFTGRDQKMAKLRPVFSDELASLQ